MKIVCVGDSNTWGYDSRSIFGDQYPHPIRWCGRLEQAGYEVSNYGFNGLCIPQEEQREWLLRLIEKEKPFSCMTIMLGSNDLLRNDSAETICKHMGELMDCLKEYREQILLIAPPVLQKGTWVENKKMIEESCALGSLYKDLARRMNIAFADAGEWNIDLLYDGVHFSPQGHETFAAQLIKRLSDRVN